MYVVTFQVMWFLGLFVLVTLFGHCHNYISSSSVAKIRLAHTEQKLLHPSGNQICPPMVRMPVIFWKTRGWISCVAFRIIEEKQTPIPIFPNATTHLYAFKENQHMIIELGL